MVQLTLILLQIIFASSAVLARSTVPANELVHIGTYRSPITERGDVQSFDENNYYVSPNAASWNAADVDCRNQLGPNATLIAFESEEEWDFVKLMLERYGFGTTYWTSGIYNPTRSLWGWVANGHPLPPWAPWAPGFPSTPNQLLRVLLYYTSRYDSRWQTVPNTQLHRYICELQQVTIVVPCYQTNDLAIVLDSSGSIGAANFVIAKDFVDQLTGAFTRHSESRLSYITYSTGATVRIDIRNAFTPAQISTIILNTPFEAGSTATHLGIDAGVAQFSASPRALPRNMVVLTDGVSNNRALTVASANVAISQGIRTFSVGITPNVNQEELLAIAGNDPSRVFTSHDFAELVKLLAPLSLKICP